MTASTCPLRATRLATSGISQPPGTQYRSMLSSGTLCLVRQEWAPSTNRCTTVSLKRLATIATHPVALGLQVAQVLARRRRLDRHPLDDLQAVALEARALGGVVAEQAQGRQAEVDKDLRPGAVVTRVGGEAQLEVGLDGVAA